MCTGSVKFYVNVRGVDDREECGVGMEEFELYCWCCIWLTLGFCGTLVKGDDDDVGTTFFCAGGSTDGRLGGKFGEKGCTCRGGEGSWIGDVGEAVAERKVDGVENAGAVALDTRTPSG